MQAILKTMDSIAWSNANVLITGETGTGKEYVAKYIHQSGDRAKQNFVSINCAAIPEALLESELFGYKKGAFTGAYADQIGLIERANGGTVFLDEIGDMPMSLQAKILRVLQERKVRPVGSSTEKPVDFKLISATHKDLRTEIENSRFREDLFYRLNVIPINLPPLRQRREDIPNLINKFASHFSEKYGLPMPKFTPQTIEDLCQRRWPGNIRELENLVEQVTVLQNKESDFVQVHDLPRTIDECGHKGIKYVFENLNELPSLTELSNQYVDFVLKHVSYHQGNAAAILGVSRRTIYRKIHKEILDFTS